MERAKNGESVLAWDSENGIVMTGVVSDVQDGEADLEFPRVNGETGSCSPIDLDEAVVIPEWVSEFIEKARWAVDQLPLETRKMLFGDEEK